MRSAQFPWYLVIVAGILMVPTLAVIGALMALNRQDAECRATGRYLTTGMVPPAMICVNDAEHEAWVRSGTLPENFYRGLKP